MQKRKRGHVRTAFACAVRQVKHTQRLREYPEFPDYTDMEMCGIFRSMAADQGMEVSGDVYDDLTRLVGQARKRKNVGNGRTARNILDRAIDRHAVNLRSGKITKDCFGTLVRQDLEGIDCRTI